MPRSRGEEERGEEEDEDVVKGLLELFRIGEEDEESICT